MGTDTRRSTRFGRCSRTKRPANCMLYCVLLRENLQSHHLNCFPPIISSDALFLLSVRVHVSLCNTETAHPLLLIVLIVSCRIHIISHQGAGFQAPRLCPADLPAPSPSPPSPPLLPLLPLLALVLRVRGGGVSGLLGTNATTQFFGTRLFTWVMRVSFWALFRTSVCGTAHIRLLISTQQVQEHRRFRLLHFYLHYM